MEYRKDSPVLTRVYAWFSALIAEDTDLLDDLLAHGVPVDVPHPLRHSTALMEATRLGRAAMVHWLLERGAAPAFLCGLPLGTPLHCALRRQHWAIAGLLAEAMESGAVIDAYGRTPLHLLCMEAVDGRSLHDTLSLARTLIAKDCPLDALDHEGTTALHHCVINDLGEIAMLLLENGANPNALIPDTRVSPLAIAALEKNLTLATLLLKFGADTFQKTRDGSSPATILPSILRLAADVTLSHTHPEPSHGARRTRILN
jgi:ankyrin repeat protein